MVKQYRKKPVVIEAVQFTGDNHKEVVEFAPVAGYVTLNGVTSLAIPTLEGTMNAVAGDYIIKGVQGEFYPCKPDIFTATYEEV